MKVPQISLVIFMCALIKSTKGITLSTNLGKLIGNDILVPGVGTVYTFLNIPYAKPPVGNLRLRKPQPYGTWQSTLDATSYGPSCMQPQYGITDVAANREMSEDCLHLNIFVPNTVNTTANKSVMIWIHGGAYTIGQSNAFDGTSLSLNGDVILVTINYRLGFFGFFGTGKPDSPGNYGLWDQHLAIKWVHDNIASFGGDPQSVTIFGESAGGGSVSFQSFFPGNQGLFQKVISQSGVALSEFLRLQQSTLDRNVDAYFNYLNCSSADIVDSMSCLRNESAIDIQNTVDTALAPYGGFSPLIDGDFVRGHAEKILESTESEEYQFFTSIDYMVGSLNGDGAVVIPGFIPPSVQKSFSFSVQDGFPSSVLTMYLSGFFASYHQNKSSVKERIDDLYKTNVSDAQQGNLIVDLLTDFGFTFPALMSADFHYLRSISRNKSKTFVYHMTRISSIQSIVYPGWTYPWLQRLTHGMDVLYLFNTSVFGGNQEDLDLARQMLTYWTNFAKKSDPNGQDVPFWHEYNHLGRVQILDIDIKHRDKKDIFGERLSFWLDSVYNENKTIGTNLGNITGVVNLVSGAGTVYSFKNIPYGKPPIGELRFLRPQPYGLWNNTLDATEYGPFCMQDSDGPGRDKVMSEDCLQMNIFVPYSLSNVSKSVMIFIHGGIYSVGSGTSFDGTMFTLRGNVILVTINYRLGPFGFLSTQDSVVPGNVGLWDQRLAFEWVKDNIHEYGGNPDSITLFGGSAGGGSVSFQSLYPGNRGLFQRVISMSGVAQSKIMQFDRESMAVATSAVLTRCNCLSTNTTKAIDCLRIIPAKVLAGPEIFKPIKDGNIIIHDFAEQLNLDKYSDVFKFFTSLDYMTGILNGDGNVELRLYVPTNSTSAYNSSLENGLTTEFLCDYFAGFISRTWYNNVTGIDDDICNLYRKTHSVVDQSNSITDLMTDFLFRFPAIKSADIHKQDSNVNAGSTYVYEMTRVYPLQKQVIPGWTYHWTQRAVHGMDGFYLQQSDRRMTQVNETADLLLAHEMIHYWTTFAKTGKPDDHTSVPKWSQYGAGMKVQYLDLSIGSQSNQYPDRKTFWLETVPKKMSGNVNRQSSTSVTDSADVHRVNITVSLSILLFCAKFL